MSIFLVERMRINHSLKYTMLFLFVVPLFVSRCNSLSFVTTRCHLLYHSLSLVVPPVFIRCTNRCHSLSLVIIRCHSLYHLLSLVVTRYTKTDRIISFLAKPSKRTNYILHNHKLPNSCYEFQFSGVPPTKWFHIFSSLTHFNPMLCFYTPCKSHKFRDFLENVLIIESLNICTVRIILLSL